MNWVHFALWLGVLLVYVVAVAWRGKTFIDMVEQIFSFGAFSVFLLSSVLSLTAIFWVILKDLDATASRAMYAYVGSSLAWPLFLLLHWCVVPTGTTEEPEQAQDDDFKEETMHKHMFYGIIPQAFALFSAFVAAAMVTAAVWEDSVVPLRVLLIVWVIQAAYDATLWNAQYFVWIRNRVAKDGETTLSLLRAIWNGDSADAEADPEAQAGADSEAAEDNT